jgi:hypothetical protein
MSLAEEQVNERADKRRCPDDDEPEYGTCRGMFIFKEHHSLDNVADDGYEDEYQEKQRIGYTASISRHEYSPHNQMAVSSGHTSYRDRRCVLTLSTRVYGREGFEVATWFTSFSCGIVSIAL